MRVDEGDDPRRGAPKKMEMWEVAGAKRGTERHAAVNGARRVARALKIQVHARQVHARLSFPPRRLLPRRRKPPSSSLPKPPTLAPAPLSLEA